MSKISRYLSKIIQLPPRLLMRKVSAKIRTYFNDRHNRTQDKVKPTFAYAYKPCALSTRFSSNDIPNLSQLSTSNLALLTSYYLEHRFDLLGSGWVIVRRGMSCRGLHGHRYEANCSTEPEEDFHDTVNYLEIVRIRSFIPKSYTPIDWHLDFKSGYRWDPKAWFRDIQYGHCEGADIKVPWELARMQHLPQLALAKVCADNGALGFSLPSIYSEEFRNQVLDFISANPPRYGVNWSCTMDVAIRAANLLIAYDLFKASGVTFDTDFEFIFTRSIFEHGLHITQNLEWSEEFRGNHYLADIAGLLYVSAYLPEGDETDAWFAFSVQELVREVKHQFHEDGSNFEASTAYHRLSAEIVVYCTALVLGLSEERLASLAKYDSTLWLAKPQLQQAPIKKYQLFSPNQSTHTYTSVFPVWYFERLERMAEFTMHITKYSGIIHQVGDNDSGRFFKLSLSYNKLSTQSVVNKYQNSQDYHEMSPQTPYLEECHLDHKHLVAAINGLFQREDFLVFSSSADLERNLISNLAKGIQIKSHIPEDSHLAATTYSRAFSINNSWLNIVKGHKCSRREFSFTGASLLDSLICHSYPDFGLYIFRSGRLYLAVRAGSVGQSNLGGHAHNDQLSVELQVDGKDIIADPGSFIYTPLPKSRNRYRSIHAHFAPALDGEEPAPFNLGLFRLGNAIRGNCLMLGETEIVCQTTNGMITMTRHVQFNDSSVIISDYYPEGHFITCNKEPVSYSSGYGIAWTQ